MKVLIIEPGKEPEKRDIDNSLETLQKVVDGYIEAVYPFTDNVALICNENGKFRPDLKPNRMIPNDVIKGTFILCGIGEEDFTDLPDDLAEKYRQKFLRPEFFISTPNHLFKIAAVYD